MIGHKWGSFIHFWNVCTLDSCEDLLLILIKLNLDRSLIGKLASKHVGKEVGWDKAAHHFNSNLGVVQGFVLCHVNFLRTARTKNVNPANSRMNLKKIGKIA